MGTSVARASAVSDMVSKAAAYGMPAAQVNGMDAVEVYEATKKAIDAIAGGDGPHFLEMLTYRYEGHSMGDPLRYRTKDEVEKWRENDPIGILERHLLNEEEVAQDELDSIDEEVEKIINEAVEFAEESPLPAPEDLFKDIYVEATTNDSTSS
jgi:pyruvate dehydrogenase E1 component alpha subunit